MSDLNLITMFLKYCLLMVSPALDVCICDFKFIPLLTLTKLLEIVVLLKRELVQSLEPMEVPCLMVHLPYIVP